MFDYLSSDQVSYFSGPFLAIEYRVSLPILLNEYKHRIVRRREIKYCDDNAEYPLAYGCSIQLWGEYGFDDSLIGLEIKWIFPHGGCSGA